MVSQFRPFGNQALTGGGSVFDDIFETDPTGQRLLFERRLGGLNPFQQSQVSNLFEPTFARFLGALGEESLGGVPDLTFKSFLDTQFNPLREFLRLPQEQTRGTAGPTLFNFRR